MPAANEMVVGIMAVMAQGARSIWTATARAGADRHSAKNRYLPLGVLRRPLVRSAGSRTNFELFLIYYLPAHFIGVAGRLDVAALARRAALDVDVEARDAVELNEPSLLLTSR
jgi:hypothetical protein